MLTTNKRGTIPSAPSSSSSWTITNQESLSEVLPLVEVTTRSSALTQVPTSIATSTTSTSTTNAEAQQSGSNMEKPAASSATTTAASAAAASFRLFLLVWLVLQSSSQTLLGRYNRSSVPEDELYDINTMLLMVEYFKLLFSCVLELYFMYRQNDKSTSPSKQLTTLSSAMLRCKDHCKDGWKMAIPAILYWIGNNMAYVAISNLSAPVFQVLLQVKLLMTAFLSVCFLQRKYVFRQWLCLLALTVGVAIVVVGESASASLGASFEWIMGFISPVVSTSGLAESPNAILEQAKRNITATAAAANAISTSTAPKQSTFVGIVAVAAACFSGSMATVFFEIVLKQRQLSAGKKDKSMPGDAMKRQHSIDLEGAQSKKSSTALRRINSSLASMTDDDSISNQHIGKPTATNAAAKVKESNADDASSEPSKPPTSIWMRNIQLAFFSIIVANMRVVHARLNTPESEQQPFFHGFRGLVWIQVVWLAVGGLVVASVIKYADSVMKGLATGFSVLLATAFSILFMGMKLTGGFLVGATLIIASVYFFSNPLPSKEQLCSRRQIMMFTMVLLLMFAFEAIATAHPQYTL